MNYIRVNYQPLVSNDCDLCEGGNEPKLLHHSLVRMIVGSWLPQLKPSKNRSKRVRKKLHKRLASPMLGPPLTLQIDEKTLTQIEFALATRRAA